MSMEPPTDLAERSKTLDYANAPGVVESHPQNAPHQNEPLRTLSTLQGEATHALIQTIAARFGSAPTPIQIVEASRDSRPKQANQNRGAALRTASTTRAARYFKDFPRPGWTLLGVEVNVGDVRFDLVWIKDGLVEADEIKSGRIGAWTQAEHVRIQLFEQFLAGKHHWGSAFNGVRFVPLLQPKKSYLYLGEE